MRRIIGRFPRFSKVMTAMLLGTSIVAIGLTHTGVANAANPPGYVGLSSFHEGCDRAIRSLSWGEGCVGVNNWADSRYTVVNVHFRDTMTDGHYVTVQFNPSWAGGSTWYSLKRTTDGGWTSEAYRFDIPQLANSISFRIIRSGVGSTLGIGTATLNG